MLGGANHGENGYTNQVAGDQLQAQGVARAETYRKAWYKYPKGKGWDCVLRCVDPKMREIMAKAMEGICDNPNWGYDYNGRNTGYKAAKAKSWDTFAVDTPVETDCSAAVTVCCASAGIPEAQILIDGWNCMTTYVMRSMLMRTGQFECLTDPKYLNGDQWLVRGDILLNELNHVELSLSDGSMVDKEWKNMDKKKFVQECYTSLLCRNGAEAEINAWVQAADRLNPQEIMEGIAYSAEGIREWISMMYKLMLNRKPDPTGLEHWTKMIQSGKSRGDILDAIKGSKEYKDLHKIK